MLLFELAMLCMVLKMFLQFGVCCSYWLCYIKFMICFMQHLMFVDLDSDGSSDDTDAKDDFQSDEFLRILL
jgi:hypothetical protein